MPDDDEDIAFSKYARRDDRRRTVGQGGHHSRKNFKKMFPKTKPFARMSNTDRRSDSGSFNHISG